MRVARKKNQAEPSTPPPGGENTGAVEQVVAGSKQHAGRTPSQAGGGVVPPPLGGEGEGGGDSSRHERNQRILLGLAVTILLVLITGSAFAMGYYMGNQDAGIRTLVKDRRGALNPGAGPPGGPGEEGGQEGGLRPPESDQRREDPGGPLRDQLKEQFGDQDTEFIKGEVISVDGSTITVQTPHGSETLTITGETRLLGAGPDGAGGGRDIASRLVPGSRAALLVRKAADGGLEVVAVRVTEEEPAR